MGEQFVAGDKYWVIILIASVTSLGQGRASRSWVLLASPMASLIWGLEVLGSGELGVTEIAF